MPSIKNVLYPAAHHGATLHALHVFEAPVVPILIDTGDYVERIREENALLMRMLREKVNFAESSVPLRTKVEEDTQASAADHILAYADVHHIDLIVMGTHGRKSPGRLFMGSAHAEVVREATCPMLIVKSPSQAEDAAASSSVSEQELEPV